MKYLTEDNIVAGAIPKQWDIKANVSDIIKVLELSIRDEEQFIIDLFISAGGEDYNLYIHMDRDTMEMNVGTFTRKGDLGKFISAFNNSLTVELHLERVHLPVYVEDDANCDSLEGTLEDIEKYLSDIRKEYSTCLNLRIESYTEWGDDYMRLLFTREENASELGDRLKKEAVDIRRQAKEKALSPERKKKADAQAIRKKVKAIATLKKKLAADKKKLKELEA